MGAMAMEIRYWKVKSDVWQSASQPAVKVSTDRLEALTSALRLVGRAQLVWHESAAAAPQRCPSTPTAEGLKSYRRTRS